MSKRTPDGMTYERDAERVEARGFLAVRELLTTITAKVDAIDDGSCAAATRSEAASSPIDAQRRETSSNQLHDIHTAALAFHDEVTRILRGVTQ